MLFWLERWKIWCTKFFVGDKPKLQSCQIYEEESKLSICAWHNDTNFVLYNVEKVTKERSLVMHRQHSEKLAIVFGLMNWAPGYVIRIHKILRVSGDILWWETLAHRFRHFGCGLCSYGDYWWRKNSGHWFSHLFTFYWRL